jgi:hypothetical protein
MITIRNVKKGLIKMHIFNKIALFFVVLYSVFIIVNTYLGESEQVQSNVIYFLLNGFAYIVSALEMEKEKQDLILKE